MKFSRVQATYLTDIPVTPPSLRDEPSRASLILVEIETGDGIGGYGKAGGDPDIVNFINRQSARLPQGPEPLPDGADLGPDGSGIRPSGSRILGAPP